MRKLITFLTMILLTASLTSHAAESPFKPKLPFRSAVITYDITGTESGSEVLYIKEGGAYEAKHRKTAVKIFGISRKTEILDISTPEWVYSINVNEKSGTKNVNPIIYMNEEYNKLSKSDQKKVIANAEKFGNAYMKNLNGEVVKNAETILGYKCDLVTMMGVRVYSISGTGIPLKSSSEMMGVKMEQTAKSVDKTTPPDKVFEVPAGIKITHDPRGDEASRDFARITVQSLVEGKDPMQANTQEAIRRSAAENGEEMPSKEEMDQMMKMFGGQK